MPRSKYDKSMKRSFFFLLSDDTLTESNKSFRQQHIVNDLEKHVLTAYTQLIIIKEEAFKKKKKKLFGFFFQDQRKRNIGSFKRRTAHVK
jgi:hypothetical protein